MTIKVKNMARICFLISSLLVFTGLIFSFGLYTAAHKTPLFEVIRNIKDDVELVFDEAPQLTGLKPTAWVSPARYDGSGVVVNDAQAPKDDLIFLQGFFDDDIGLRLIRRDGTVVAQWRLLYSELASEISHLNTPPTTDWNVDSHGAVVLPDGSVVFNLDDVGLFKLDRCGRKVWTVDMPTHHSVEHNADGTYWVSAAQKIYEEDDPSFPLFKPPYVQDALLHISADGEILKLISLMDLFVKNNQLALLTLAGGDTRSVFSANRLDVQREIFHLNDVEELPKNIADDFPIFKAGDLLVSLRNRNLVMVIDPITKSIKWLKIGPWLRQHDADWKKGGTITVFDNNRDGTETGEILGSSSIVEIDPATSKVSTIYGGPEHQFFYSVRRGKHQNLGDGRVLITESEAGRVFEINKDKKIIWEYLNKYSETETGRINEARLYRSKYFKIKDWACPAS